MISSVTTPELRPTHRRGTITLVAAAAKKSGDTAKATEAVAAMKTSHSWKILKEMVKDGDFPNWIREYADSIAKDKAPQGYRNALCR